MVQVENKQWNSIEHSLLSSRYASCLVLHDLTGQGLGPSSELLIASQLTEISVNTIESVSVGANEFSGYLEFASTIEGEDGDAAVLKNFTESVLQALVNIRRNPEHFEFRGAHLVYEEQFKQDRAKDPLIDVRDEAYMVDILPLLELNEFGFDRATDARRIFTDAQEVLILDQ